MTRREKIQSIKEVTEIKDMLDNEYCDEEVIRSLQLIWEADPSPLNTFQYAIVLRQDKHHERREEAIALLKTLTSYEEYAREAFYYIGLTYFSLGDYRTALYFCEQVYRYDPDNEQIKVLHTAISFCHEQSSRIQAQDNTMKVGVGVGILAIGIGLAVSYLRSRK